MNEEMKTHLQKLAKRKCWCAEEDFVVDDYAGGNVDDAYEGGFDDGEALLACYLLEKFS